MATRLICERCEEEHANGELEGTWGTQPSQKAAGYCDKHGHHDEFYTMEL